VGAGGGTSVARTDHAPQISTRTQPSLTVDQARLRREMESQLFTIYISLKVEYKTSS
jgi:hypothetical protein